MRARPLSRPAVRRAALLTASAATTSLLLTGLLPGPASADGETASPVTLAATTVDRTTDPLGIDDTHPRLGWQLLSHRNGESQSAYEIAVSSSAGKAASGTADVWDSGKVTSDQSVDVPYGGPAPHTGRSYYWRVRAWDAQGRATAWSRVSSWEMGLLSSTDWKAGWIGAPSTSAPDFGGTSWIWYPEGDPASTAPQATRYFRRTLDLPAGATVSTARFLLTADDDFDLYVNGRKIASSPRVTDSWKQSMLVDVASALHPGTNTIAVAAENTSPGPAGLLGRLRVGLAGGSPVELVTDGSWRTAQTAPAGWEQPGFDDSGWAAADAVAPYGQGPWGQNVSLPPAPVPYLRRELTVSKPVTRARLYVTSLGLYEAYINGRRVGKDHFAPGWTDYNKRLQYQTYDVTSLLHTGTNAIGALLSNGWYAGNIGFAGSHIYGQQPRFGAQLVIEHPDGTSQTVVSDGSWKTAPSPITSSDIYAGETYDARAEQAGWSTPGFDDHTWQRVSVDTTAHPHLVAQTGPEIRVEQVLHPVRMTEPKPGVYIFDMGQNMVGWNRLTVSGPAGTTVTLRNGEILNPDGTLYTANLRAAKDTDTYTLSGHGTETYEPHFTYRGFRYIEVTGYPGTPATNSVAGVVAHAGADPSGQITTSDSLVNRIQHNIVWGEKGNFWSVPTDCPQRDERLGWTGDIGAFAPTSTFNMNVDTFLDKFATDLSDAQHADGGFTDVAPDVLNNEGTAGWGDAGVIVPFTLWQRYGDVQVVRDHYDAMAHWIDYLTAHSTGLIRPASGYGDWLNVNDGTPLDLIGTAYFADSTAMMARMADALGRSGDAAAYRALWSRIRDAFDAKYVTADGRVGNGSQTSYVLALQDNLLPAGLTTAAANGLVANIQAHDWHLTTGFLGTGGLLPVLTATGHADIAYRLLEQTTFPSWGYEIADGATTVWERWDGIRPDGTPNDPGMNSFNHYGLGSVGDWIYRTVGGIDPDPAHPGYRHFFLRPVPGGGLNRVDESYRSPYGLIRNHWERSGGHLVLRVTVPANSTATVYVPAAARAAVSAPPDARFTGMSGGAAVFAIGSGSYTFVAR